MRAVCAEHTELQWLFTQCFSHEETLHGTEIPKEDK